MNNYYHSERIKIAKLWIQGSGNIADTLTILDKYLFGGEFLSLYFQLLKHLIGQ